MKVHAPNFLIVGSGVYSSAGGMSLVEKIFVKQSLKDGLRVDRRSVDDNRQVNFEFVGGQCGHVIVHLGQTKVMAVVSASIVRPFPDRPLEGVLGIYLEWSGPITSDLSDEDPRRGRVSRLLERLFKSARTVDTESLCILPGEQVWSIRLDVHVLDDCGNVQDAACLAALAALLDFRRQDSTVIDGRAVVVHRCSSWICRSFIHIIVFHI